MSRLPLTRPTNIAQDLTLATLEDVDLNLADLFNASISRGQGLIQNRTFRGCRIQGPSVLLVQAGCTFDDVNFGGNGGDVRNLILYPAGPLALGTVPIRDCAFISCEFYNVGFTGPRAFLDQLLTLDTGEA